MDLRNEQNQTSRNETPLTSWKEIGAYIGRNDATARRWEKEEGLPVHRHAHKLRSSVYAYPSEIDAWRTSRKQTAEPVAAPPVPLWRSLLAPPRSLAFGVTMAMCLVMVGNGIRPQRVSAQGGLAKRLICEGVCADNEADLSPDAKTMIQTEWVSGDLMIRDLASGQTRRLLVKSGSFGDGSAGQDAYAEKPVFSPDMKQVVYLWDNGKRGSDEIAQLRIVSTEPGAIPRVIVNNPENDYYEPQIWSPDGKSVLALVRRKADKTWQIAWVSIEDGSTRQLASLGWRIQGGRMKPSLSPDGRYIAYAALATNPKTARPKPDEPTDTRIYVMTSDGSVQTEVVKNAGVHNNPVWSADGTHLLFTSDQGGQLSLWSIPVREGRATGLAKLVLGDTGDVWVLGMRSGSLYYEPASAGVRQIDYVSIAALDGGGTEEHFVGTYPSWSPDGTLLAFTRPRPGTRNDLNLVIHNMETGEETVFFRPGLLRAPAIWFQDGASLLKATVEYDGNGEKPETAALQRLNLRTGQFTEVLKFGSRYYGNDFPVSSDGTTLYLGVRESGDLAGPVNQIGAFDLASRQERKIYSLLPGRSLAGLRVSPDGRSILFRSAGPAESYLELLSIDGRDYREIYKGKDMSGISWASDGQNVLFAQVAGSNRWRMMKLPIQGGAPVFTGLEVSSQDVRALPLPHPDGKRVVFSSRERQSQLWALDNVSSALR